MSLIPPPPHGLVVACKWACAVLVLIIVYNVFMAGGAP